MIVVFIDKIALPLTRLKTKFKTISIGYFLGDYSHFSGTSLDHYLKLSIFVLNHRINSRTDGNQKYPEHLFIQTKKELKSCVHYKL